MPLIKVMGDSKDIDPRARDIGVRVSKFRKAAKITAPHLASLLGVQKDAVNRIQSGRNLSQWLKLADLATLLKVTPNDLLGFNSVTDREVVRAALEASYQALGLNEDEVRILAESILTVIDEPPVESANLDRVTLARAQSEIEVRRLLRSKLAQ